MRRRSISTLLVLAVLLAGCAIGKPIPETETYVIEPSPPVQGVTRRLGTLRMGAVRVAPIFAGNNLVVRMSAVRYAADVSHAFIAAPEEMLGTAIARWLDRAGAFESVTQPGTRAPASHALEATITDLYGDFRPGRRPAAVLTIQFTLVDLTGSSPSVVLERTIARTVPLVESTPEALVKGYGEALSAILTELVSAI